MKGLKVYVISWWSFKKQKFVVKSFMYRKSAVKFAVKLTEDTDSNFRVFTGYNLNEKIEEFNF